VLVEVLATGILERVELPALPALKTIFESLAKYDIY